jgi:hypothetical protein
MHTTGMSLKAIGRQMGYCSRPTGEKTHTNQQCALLDLSLADFRRFLTVLFDRRLLGSQCCLSTRLVANGIHLTKCCNALSSRSDVTRGLLVMHVNHASHALLKIQYVRTSNLGI